MKARSTPRRSAATSVLVAPTCSAASAAISRASVPKSRGCRASCAASSRPAEAEKPGLAGEACLDLIAERPLQRHRRQRRAQPRRGRHTLDLEAVGALHDGRAQAVLVGQRLDALGRLALQAERGGDQAPIAQLVPQARQRSLEAEEHARPARRRPRSPRCAPPAARPAPQTSSFRWRRRAACASARPTGDAATKLARSSARSAAADAAHGTGDAHQHDVAQALGIDRGGCARRLQHGSRHGRASPQIGHCPRSGGRGRSRSARRTRKSPEATSASCRVSARTPSAYRCQPRRGLRCASCVPCAPCCTSGARHSPHRLPIAPFRPTRVIFALWDCVRGNRVSRSTLSARWTGGASRSAGAAMRSRSASLRTGQTWHAGQLNGWLTDQGHLYGTRSMPP